jgi:hypothetical protein
VAALLELVIQNNCHGRKGSCSFYEIKLLAIDGLTVSVVDKYSKPGDMCRCCADFTKGSQRGEPTVSFP